MLVLSLVISFLLLILIYACRYDKRLALQRKRFREERQKYTEEDFISDLKDANLNVNYGIEFSLINHEYWKNNDPELPLLYPFLNDNLVNVWSIDEEIEDLVNIFLERHSVNKRYRWQDDELMNLITFSDVIIFLIFLENLMQNESSSRIE